MRPVILPSLLAAAALALTAAAQLCAGQWADWQWMNPRPQGWSLHGIGQLLGLPLVAVGNQGTILVQADDGWQPLATGRDYDLFDIASNDEIAVAVGGRFYSQGEGPIPDYGVIISSTDGLIWTERHRSFERVATNVLYDGGKFVAVGTTLVAASVDGVHWQEYPLPESMMDVSFGTLAWNGGRFVCTAVDPAAWLGGTFAVFVSDDGLAWEKVQLGDEIPQMTARGLAWGNGRFVVIGGAWPNVVYVITSDDGVIWQLSPTRNPPPPGTTCLVFEAGVFIAAGESPGSPFGWVSHSPDGENWTTRDVNIDENFYDVTWLGDHYLAVGQDGVMATSPDGFEWTETSSNAIDYDGRPADMTLASDTGTLVAVGEENIVATSEDGVRWHSQVLPGLPGANLTKVQRVNGSFWVGSEYGTLWRSADGTSWADAHAEPARCELVDIAGNGATLVVVGVDQAAGYTPLVLTSVDDGVTWVRQDFWGVENRLAHVVWHGDRFLALGGLGLVMTSADGETWVSSRVEGVMGFEAIAQNGEKVIIVGSTANMTGDLIITTEDCLTFDVAEAPRRYLHDITWTGTHFVAIGYGDDNMITSRDGVTWERDEYGLNVAPWCVAGDDTTLYVAGGRGTILRAHHVSTVPRIPAGRLRQGP